MLFKNKKRLKEPVNRGFYAVAGGTYGGDFLVFIKENNDSYDFITLPDKKPLEVPIDAFKRGIENRILDYITTLPKSVFSVVEMEYEKLNKHNGSSTTKADNKPDKRPTSNSQNCSS